MMINTQDRRLLTSEIQFPEGPRWHDGYLWFEDTVGEKLRRVSPAGDIETVVDVPGRASGLGFLSDGTPLVMSMFEKRLFRVERGRLVEAADLSSEVEYPVNDMIVDAQGRTYIGHFGYDLFGGATPRPTNLLMVDSAGQVRSVADGLVFPNGMAITEDGLTFYVAETWGHRITAFDIARDGSLHNGRVFVELGERHPDGICLDADGALWVASAMESEFIRVAPTGEISESIECPGRIATSCALGGPDGSTLFMCEAETDVERIGRGDSSGFIEMVSVAVPRGHTIP